jgi:RNA polymerase sigma-70 factor (ECF subfamily)
MDTAMNDDPDQRTSASLLHRLQNDVSDEAAWTTFVERYGPRIYSWCRQWQLQDPDAQDVTQEVLLELVDKLRRFRYDPSRSFRAWLKTLVHHAWQDFLARHRRGGVSGDSDLWDNVAAREDLEQQLQQMFDRALLDEAMARVQQRVAPHTWEAFRLLTFEGLRGPEVAARLGMQVTMAYVAKSKVQKMLRQEVDRLEAGECPHDPLPR